MAGTGEGRATPTDEAHLLRAVELAERGWGRVHPNPMVGCVLVRDGEVVGEGWHREFGGPHAEVEALTAAGDAARGATAYLSLEPCHHQGKTGPCTRALLEAGVSRVIYGARDPGPESGGGGEWLRDAGVEVVGPLHSAREARRLNPAFFHRETHRPWVTLKLALSLDGKIAAAPGVRTRLSGAASERALHRLRAGYDGILVGARTAKVDDPLLTVRGEISPRTPPVRIVLDARGTLDPGARLFTEGGSPVWIITGPHPDEGWASRLRERGAHLISTPLTAEGRVEPAAVLREFRAREVRSLLCEGGGVLGSALLEAGVVDRLILVQAPVFLGEGGVPAFPHLKGTLSPTGWKPTEPPRQEGDDSWITLDREE